ncbi:MAG: hypothetical protein A2Y40_10750 [Candidatus Margulisbacteria bacterium GWF2_35_9]|nr:MAG: hypothetical protein A2Y40_10750 [Candidatus Margulisbacteria bacterium GWF2_35_9]
MVDQHTLDRTRVLEFVKAYLYVVESSVIEISHKRNTLKSRVKQLSLVYKIPKDFANYLSLFLMITKFIYVEDKIWKVNKVLQDKLDRPEFLQKNLYKFLFFTRDYNEYYKSPMVFNTIYANNDFEVIRKRRCILKTLLVYVGEEKVSFERIYQTIIKRYAFFRTYNDPENFYYTKGDVLPNKQFIFTFIFKTLQYLGVIEIVQKGKTVSDYYFKIMEYGAKLIASYSGNEKNVDSRLSDVESKIEITDPHIAIKTKETKSGTLNFIFNNIYPQHHDYTTIFSDKQFVSAASEDKNLLSALRQQLVRKVQHDKIPNLLV